MAISVEMQHWRSESVGRVRVVVEHVLADRPGDWRVSITGSQANDRWELKITGPNAFERSYTLEGSPKEQLLAERGRSRVHGPELGVSFFSGLERGAPTLERR